MTVFEEAVNGYAELSKEFKGKSPNLDRCGQILAKLKIALTQLSFLPNEEAPSNKVFIWLPLGAECFEIKKWAWVPQKIII